MPRTRRSKKYKRKTVKRNKKGGQFGKIGQKLGKEIGPVARSFATQLGQTLFNEVTGKSNIQLPPTQITYKAPTHSMLSNPTIINQLKYPITLDNKAIPKNVPEKIEYLESKVAKANALFRGLTTFSYTSLARILITNMTAKTNAAYLTTEYIRDIISLFGDVVQAALDDIITADVSVSENVVKSIITDDTLSPGDIKTTLVRVLAKHLQKMAPKLKEELRKTKFVGVSEEFTPIIKTHLDALFNDLKEELSTTIIRKITNAVDKLTVNNISAEWRTKKKNYKKNLKKSSNTNSTNL